MIIYIENSVSKADQLIFKNEEVAEETISALLCLIKNSGNKKSPDCVGKWGFVFVTHVGYSVFTIKLAKL